MECEVKMERMNVENFNYDSIKYFVSVASHGNIRKAAYSLGISQSALSQSMKNLEQTLGVTLFNRNTRGIILTLEGKLLYEEAKIGKEYFENAIIQIFRMNKFETLKTFKISTSGTLFTIFIAPIMRKIIEKYPKINFEIISVATKKDVVEKLQKEEIDLALLKTSGRFPLKEVATHKLKELNYAFVYHKNYFQFDKKVQIDAIKDIPVITKKRTGRNNSSWVMTSFSHIIICESDRNILELIKSGAGIGVYSKEYIEEEKLSTVELEDVPETKRIVEASFLNSNKIAKDIVAMMKKNQS